MKTLLSTTGDTTKTIVSDEHDESLTFVSRQNLEATFKSVAMKREATFDKDLKPVAEIPGVIVEQMMRDGSWNDPAAIKKWLNDPQNECFRIWKGRV
jgi:hypothetical protein